MSIVVLRFLNSDSATTSEIQLLIFLFYSQILPVASFTFLASPPYVYRHGVQATLPPTCASHPEHVYVLHSQVLTFWQSPESTVSLDTVKSSGLQFLSVLSFFG